MLYNRGNPLRQGNLYAADPSDDNIELLPLLAAGKLRSITEHCDSWAACRSPDHPLGRQARYMVVSDSPARPQVGIGRFSDMPGALMNR